MHIGTTDGHSENSQLGRAVKALNALLLKPGSAAVAVAKNMIATASPTTFEGKALEIFKKWMGKGPPKLTAAGAGAFILASSGIEACFTVHRLYKLKVKTL